MSNTNTIQFSNITDPTDNVAWYFASFDPAFTMIDSTMTFDKTSELLTVTTGGYIIGIYYDHRTYQLTNTLYISDASKIQGSGIFSCQMGNNPILGRNYGLGAVAAANKKVGLYDISTKPSTIQFTLCGKVDDYIIGNDASSLLPNLCADGYIFGDSDNINICVGPSVVTAVAKNYVPSFVPRPSLRDVRIERAESIFSSPDSGSTGGFPDTQTQSSSSSSNMIMFIFIILIVIVVIGVGVWIYMRHKKMKGGSW